MTNEEILMKNRDGCSLPLLKHSDEEKAEEKYQEHINKESCYVSKPDEEIYTDGFLDGLAEGRKETKAEWHDCFLSCSSPYCAAHFPAVEMQGELGNMSKRKLEAGK